MSALELFASLVIGCQILSGLVGFRGISRATIRIPLGRWKSKRWMSAAACMPVGLVSTASSGGRIASELAGQLAGYSVHATLEVPGPIWMLLHAACLALLMFAAHAARRHVRGKG